MIGAKHPLYNQEVIRIIVPTLLLAPSESDASLFTFSAALAALGIVREVEAPHPTLTGTLC